MQAFAEKLYQEIMVLYTLWQLEKGTVSEKKELEIIGKYSEWIYGVEQVTHPGFAGDLLFCYCSAFTVARVMFSADQLLSLMFQLDF